MTNNKPQIDVKNWREAYLQIFSNGLWVPSDENLKWTDETKKVEMFIDQLLKQKIERISSESSDLTQEKMLTCPVCGFTREDYNAD